MKLINNITIDTSPMPSAVTTRIFTVTGDPGAVFTITVTNEDDHFYNFSEERDKNGDLKVALAFASTPARLQTKTIDESGSYTGQIQFPAITDDDHYYVTLYADSGSETVLSKNLSNNEIYILPKIYKYKDTTLTFSLSSAGSSGSYNTLPANVTATGISSSIESGTVTPVTISINWPVSLSTSQFVIAKQPGGDDFNFTTTTTTTSNSDNSNHYIEVADVSKLSQRLAVSGTGIASGNVVKTIIPGYKDYNKSSDLEDVYTIPKIKSTDSEEVEIISDSPGGTIAIGNSSTWDAGITLTFTGSNINLEAFNNTVLEFSNLTLTIDPVVTTTDAAVSNSTTIPITSTDGIKAVDTVLMTGIGVTDSSPHVDAISAGVNITASSAQTIENGQTVTFTGSSRSATITADVKILKYGIDDMTITLALDNILTVG